MGGFNKQKTQKKQMTKRQMQDALVESNQTMSEEFGKFRTAVANVLRDMTLKQHNSEMKVENLATLSITKEDGQVSKEGSILFIDFIGRLYNEDGTVAEESFEGGASQGFFVDTATATFLPDFQAQLVGVSAGDLKEFDVTFPKDYKPDLAEKKARFKVFIRRVFNEIPSPVAAEVQAYEQKQREKRKALEAEAAAKRAKEQEAAKAPSQH